MPQPMRRRYAHGMDAPPPTHHIAASPLHQRRLREIYRSAGWPCLDTVEIELIAAGLLERVRQPGGHETLRVTDAGIAALAATLQRQRARRDAHEALVERVAREMVRAGRIAWRGLSLRARLPDGAGDGEDGAWVMAMPDVFSIRHTTVEQYLEPVVHEVKVRRSDLLADLKRQAKRLAYLQLGGECWYVLREGIARPEEIPPECGVLVATDAALDVARPAPRRPMQMPFATWMALARATPMADWRADDAQSPLVDVDAGRPAAPDDGN
jgi:hypothetical protein